jgi:two-component system sensor histidine kinase/response regulator
VGSMKPFKNRTCRMCLFCAVVGMVLFFGHAVAGGAGGENPPLKIGVLVVRGAQQCLDSWSPTADYLTRQVSGHRFVIVPLAYNRIQPHVERAEVDFIIANSAIYVGLEHWYQASCIATMKERRAGGVYTKYGGVVFCRSDREDIRTLNDLTGKTFMAVSETSLGGWLMAWREFKEIGIDPYSDFGVLRFDETHDQVVFAVRDGVVDAGTVRTGALEALSIEGKIDLSDFHVFPQRHNSGERPPYLCTTREYPGWPMARVRHTPDALAEKVAVALLQMPPDAIAAQTAGCAGWTIPLNYQPVHDCLKVLKVGPYQDLGKITFTDIVSNYGHWIITAMSFFCILAGYVGAAMKLNTQIKASNVRLNAEMELRKQKERELQEAKELAETATRAKSEFLANMSHEIRTPMNGIIAATDLALSEQVPPKIANYLKIIHGSAYSLLGIINDILDFSKIEAGKFELKEWIFRLGEVIDQVMELFVSKAAEKGIELLVDIDVNTPKVIEGDSLRLQQILTNLISNAIKFTESDGVIRMDVKEVTEIAGRAAGDEMVLAFSVKDTGTGIAPDYIDLLFEPFSQADTSSTRKYEGTGLGLSICKQLVTIMGGQIGVESVVGRGSTFFFTVRMRRPAAGPVPRLIVPPDIQGLNVLVVDDLADSRAIMRKMLLSLGFKVETLASGPEALDRLQPEQMRANPVGLIMMDWKMPGMDGIEVSRKVRQGLKLTLPIIMMTAFGKEEQRIEAEAAGINGYLTKPIYPSTLFDAIMDGFGKEGLKTAGQKKRFTTRASIYRKPLKGIRILVAEDNPTNQQVAQAILEGAGIVVTIVGNGEEAVQALQSASFDAVLMDIQMPLVNGYEATRRIRELSQGASLPIVAMTAHAMKGDEEKCLEAGMDGYISKPVNQDRLFHTLWRLLRARGRLPEVRGPEAEDALAVRSPDHDWAGVNHRPPAGGISTDNGNALPSTLPGIDMERTLQVLEIDSAAFLRILGGFRAHNYDLVEKLRHARADNDLELMRQLAHGLKGSAANIGAAELSAAAGAIEDTCTGEVIADAGPPHLEGLIDNVAAALNQVLASIQKVAKSESDHMTAPESAEAGLALDALLARLVEAIDRADPEQIRTLMPAIRQKVHQGGLLDPSSLKLLEKQLARYDYDEALETIQKITKR